ncbi:putative aarF domain-containing protein kinase [Nymphaea thermarum]|nr:putative aarF domain-containing protein kinase [Nymphaea thermarum]
MLEEVDFHKEAANIESFIGYLETMGLTRQAKAPKVYKHCSTRRVLTMERLYGVPLTDLDSIRSLVSSPETSLITALNVWYFLRKLDRANSHFTILVFLVQLLWEVRLGS